VFVVEPLTIVVVLNLSVFSAHQCQSVDVLNIIVFCHFNLMDQVFRAGDRSVPLLAQFSVRLFLYIYKRTCDCTALVYIWPESRCQSQTLILELSISLFYNIVLNLIFVIHSLSLAFLIYLNRESFHPIICIQY